jgi:protein-S-isoprenylcysteine O-methyltransferase Ste14
VPHSCARLTKLVNSSLIKRGFPRQSMRFLVDHATEDERHSNLLAKLILTLCVACFASFAWSIRKLFQRPIGMLLRMKLLSVPGFIFFLAEVYAIIRAQPAPSTSSMVGLLFYLFTLSLFWWAVPYAKHASLSISFTPSQPAKLMIEGPYRYIRHPFYSSYLAFWAAGLLVSRNPWLLIPLAVMGMFYRSAIRQEEREFGQGSLRNEYQQYRLVTGGLIPRFKARKLSS